MSGGLVQVVELACWGLEPGSRVTAKPLPERTYQPAPAILSQSELPQSEEVRAAFESVHARADLHDEFAGLTWSLEMVDLRTLIAFQRRVTLDPAKPSSPPPSSLADLLALSFGPVRMPAHRWVDALTVRSENPDLQLRPTAAGWRFHGGSPFFEVTLYEDRAFLRDGYHRAYDLLCAGIYSVPAVVIQAASPDEICPTDRWFMPHDTLLGPNPPLITDFLDPALATTYERPRLLKTIHLTVTESMEPER